MAECELCERPVLNGEIICEECACERAEERELDEEGRDDE